MQGMDQETGKFIDGIQHLTQSIRLILNTPLGSRVMLPDFGSRVVDLIDAPMTPANELEFYAATIDAIERWEDRIEIQNVKLTGRNDKGVITINITGIYEDNVVVIENIPVG